VAAGALVGAAAVGAAWLISGKGHSSASGRVVVTFEPGSARDERLLEPAFKRAVTRIDSELGLPNDLHVRVVGDATAGRLGLTGPAYEPDGNFIYLPWSFVDEARLYLSKGSYAGRLRGHPADEVLKDAVTFALYHELAHGIIHTLDVPILSREESAADSLAATLLVTSGRGAKADALAAGELFDAVARHRGESTARIVAEGYDLNLQRYFDLICRVYGSAPAHNRDLLGGDRGISPQRADICVHDYRRERRSWTRLLSHWLRGAGKLAPTD
jgi:hypothetical protein